MIGMVDAEVQGTLKYFAVLGSRLPVDGLTIAVEGSPTMSPLW